MRHTANGKQDEVLRQGPEIDLLFACVCPPGPAAVFERNPASRCAEINWNKLLELAAFHGVIPLLHRFLSQYAGEIAPSEFRADLERECHAIAIRSLCLT